MELYAYLVEKSTPKTYYPEGLHMCPRGQKTLKDESVFKGSPCGRADLFVSSSSSARRARDSESVRAAEGGGYMLTPSFLAPALWGPSLFLNDRGGHRYPLDLKEADSVQSARDVTH